MQGIEVKIEPGKQRCRRENQHAADREDGAPVCLEEPVDGCQRREARQDALASGPQQHDQCGEQRDTRWEGDQEDANARDLTQF